MKRVSLAAALALLVCSLSCAVAAAAPKQEPTPILQDAFDRSTGFSGARARTVNGPDGPTVRYFFQGASGNGIVFGELPKIEQAWVWSAVLKVPSPPPPEFFRLLAQENNDAIGPFLSWAENEDGSGTVYLQYFFLMKTATPEALETYFDLVESEQEYFAKKLSDWLTKNRGAPRAPAPR